MGFYGLSKILRKNNKHRLRSAYCCLDWWFQTEPRYTLFLLTK